VMQVEIEKLCALRSPVIGPEERSDKVASTNL
jgi:hypothetical protein